MGARHVLGVLALLAAQSLPPASAAGAPATMASERVNALFRDYWERTAADYPEWATWRGDHRFDDRLTDESPAARAERDARERAWLEQAKAIDPAALPATERVSLQIFVHERWVNVGSQDHPGWRTMSPGSQSGFHTDIAAAPARR